MKPRTRPIPPEKHEALEREQEPDIDTANDSDGVEKGVELPLTYTRQRPRHSPNHEV
jgi:hypothetical protein